jgi:hypothetical protein
VHHGQYRFLVAEQLAAIGVAADVLSSRRGAFRVPAFAPAAFAKVCELARTAAEEDRIISALPIPLLPACSPSKRFVERPNAEPAARYLVPRIAEAQ